MRDLPPDSLIARLIELKLCTVADVQRAGSRVRRMTRDLPAFDSVWIDALTQLGALSPFQARWLETASPESLRVGEYLLQDGLGAGTGSHTFLAAGPDRRNRVVMKRLTLPSDQSAAVETRLEQLIDRSRAIQSPHLAKPSGLIKTSESLFLVGPFVPGLNLSELLIRRGRFPARIVSAVADQVFSALSVLHAAGLAHGDLRLTKLRLTDRGVVVVVDSGLKPALTPELLVHAVQSSAEADAIAPERIGTNRTATAASDLYAAGCILWQLLTGRPPYPQADPLTKLAAHQTRRIGDVCELAPDTPPRLAEVIHQLTSPNPQDRPQSAEAARRRLGTRGGSRSGELARFRRQFELTVPHLATRAAAGKSRWQGLSAAAVLLGLVVLGLSDRGLRTELLDIAQRTWEKSQSNATGTLDSTRSERPRSLEIPQPDARGVITLTETGPYTARQLSAVGPLTLQAAKGVRPIIRVLDDAPLQITAQHVTLKNIDVDWSGTNPPLDSQSLVVLRSQRFHISGCRFHGPSLANASSETPSEMSDPPTENASFPTDSPQPTTASAITWESLDRRDPQAGNLHMENSSLSGIMHGLVCLATPQEITWRNVLKTHAGSAVLIEQAQTLREMKLVLDHVTLRQSGPLLTCSGPLTERVSASGIDIEAVDCVFEVAQPQPLVELRGPKVREDWPQAIRLLGDGSIMPPQAVLLAAVNPQDGILSALESDELQFEGLFFDEFDFAGPVSDHPQGSVVKKTHAPRRHAGTMPGVDAGRLATPE